MIEYIAAGNVMLDHVHFADGSGNDRETVGGPATFAYSGIKMWTDNVIQCSRLGEDYHTLFDPWVEKNQVDTRGLQVVCDMCNHTYLIYADKNGGMNPDLLNKERTEKNASLNPLLMRGTRWEDFGFMKTSPEDFERFTKEGGVKGLYLAQNCDRTYWNKVKKIKERDGFKMMWELEGSVAYPEFLENVKYACEIADLFSLNITEAQRLFGVEGDEACIEQIQKLPVEYTLFRIGERGAYSVTPDAVYYLPPAPCTVVDPTGCGNTSTGSALYAYCEGYHPLMVGIMANIGSAANIDQYGIIPDMIGIRERSFATAEKLFKEYSKKFGVK